MYKYIDDFYHFIVVQFMFFTNAFTKLVLLLVIENKLKYFHLIMHRGSLLVQFRYMCIKIHTRLLSLGGIKQKKSS